LNAGRFYITDKTSSQKEFKDHGVALMHRGSNNCNYSFFL